MSVATTLVDQVVDAGCICYAVGKVGSFTLGWGLFKVRGEGERRVAGVERPVVLL